VHWPDASNPMMLLGRLLERSDETIRRLDRIDGRLREGDQRMDAIDRKLEIKSTSGADKPGPWERIAVDGSRIALWLALLWLTGSAETATRLIGGALK
jgi:hypothetical protein